MKTAKVVFYKNALDSLDKEFQYKERSRQLIEKLSDEDRQDTLNKLAFDIGVNVFGEDAKNKDEFVLASNIADGFNIGVWDIDEHYTGLDYLLESYGLESVLECLSPALTLLDTKVIGYKVDWKKAAIQIDSLLESFKSKLNMKQSSGEDEPVNYYGVYSMPLTYGLKNQYQVMDAKGALTATASEREGTKGNHINSLGYFLSTTPKQLHSVVHGSYKGIGCVYVTYYQELTWFVNQLEVIKETIDMINSLTLPKRKRAHLILIE